jgi:hypothetical protein
MAKPEDAEVGIPVSEIVAIVGAERRLAPYFPY